ncbi:zinc finger BED domain-containing protein RICESLEEPER 2-like [Durio zibethinus]|uniref:Zinc finger BED domain-containing protein RICESLEEPER 2-like n=1 Tax=Durio zibethinus TaxID=66656 RepID=A0A6P5XKE2_DURZI|nr:zinc finger BED domain-containing protein RICESLEEPER 2-like [Durio zibethinus]
MGQGVIAICYMFFVKLHLNTEFCKPKVSILLARKELNMSSTTPDISSIPVQPTINSFTSRIVSDDGNDSMNEALDATNGNTDKTPVIDANDRECDNADPEECEKSNEKKRQKTSAVWLEFKEVTLSDGFKKGECVHCKKKLAINTINTCGDVQILPAFTDGKFDMAKMREAAAHWILMHEHPFSIIEEKDFNMMQKRGMPEWEKVSRNTIKKNCMQVYEAEKKKLKALLKTVNKISLTTDLWKSSNQKIEYMGIENKVFTLSVDNASSNDVAIRILKDTFSRNRMLLCGGKLFHVWCCAHILNLMVQDGLSEIKNVIGDVHESVNFINQNEARLNSFSDIVQQLQLSNKKLILDCKTRWNLTFEMLSIAIKFKEVFSRLKERESHYECCPSHEDWEKVEKVCEILKVFNSATKIIFGSDYPTSNLFLNEVYRVKVLLDKRMNDENEFVQAMVRKMKSKFDKYWGECNLLMSIAAILDPRCKMRVIEFCFPRMYPDREAKENIAKVRYALYEIYDEYAREYQFGNEHSAETQVHDNGISGMNIEASSSGWFEFANYVKSVETAQPQQSDLDVYLAEGCFICEGDSTKFHALEWWKASTLKYRILSKMARDILAIPITTVASEATFSAGGGVIDTYRASLSPDIVQALLCGGDWCRNLHGVKKKNKKEKKSIEIALKIP